MQNLPVELIVETATYLECRDLVNFGKTCNDLNDILDGENHLLWKEKLNTDFPSIAKCPADYKKLYISQYKAGQNWSTGNYRVTRIAESHSTRMRTMLMQQNLVFYVREDYSIIMYNADTQESVRLNQESEPVCMYLNRNKLWVADLAAKITGNYRNKNISNFFQFGIWKRELE
jgi:hypothetical protein